MQQRASSKHAPVIVRNECGWPLRAWCEDTTRRGSDQPASVGSYEAAPSVDIPSGGAEPLTIPWELEQRLLTLGTRPGSMQGGKAAAVPEAKIWIKGCKSALPPLSLSRLAVAGAALEKSRGGGLLRVAVQVQLTDGRRVVTVRSSLQVHNHTEQAV